MISSTIRRWVGACLAGAAAATLGEVRAPFPQAAADARGELVRAAAAVDSLREAALRAAVPAEVSADAAIALTYLERLRAGLGSPFRLADQARQDPRLTTAMRRTVAWALLAETAAGRAYMLDPATLDDQPAGGRSRGAGGEAGAWHLALIDSAVSAASDPRAGELTVRLGYTLARAERTVSAASVAASVKAGALLRDRELARRDAAALLDAARVARVDPLLLVAAWRAERRLRVERPPLADRLGAAYEAQAVQGGASLAAALRAADAERRAAALDTAAVSAEPRALNPGTLPPRRGWLSAAAARRAADLPSVRGAPPQAAIVTAVRQQRAHLVAATDSTEARARRARARFVARTINEETLVAERALADAAGVGGGGVGDVVLAAAVALRPYAQEPVWFPGFPAPTVAELKQQYEFAAVSFERSVPVAWRPYYLRMLATSVDDLRRVFPSLSARGVGVHFGESVLRDTALALHDPKTRTIFLPVWTSAGAIAHEFAHDLDWQAARNRRHLRGDYLTDRVVREGRGRLAAALGGLTTEPLATPDGASGFRARPAQRPTEVFARSVDWLVAAALAREGRVNGYLSTVQDEVLTGYLLVAAPDAAGRTGQALAAALGDMAEVPEPLREWFVERYGVGRDLGPYERLREVLTLSRWGRLSAGDGTPWLAPNPVPRPTAAALELLAAGRPNEAALDVTRATCGLAGRERALRRLALGRVVTLGAEARLRGAQRDGAWWPGAGGPLRREVVEARAAQRTARVFTRVRASDAARDPLQQWLGERGAACQG